MKSKFSLKLLVLVFFASGFSSLVYQVSWQRILTLYYSVENISITLIVTVYMLGLGLGAIIGGYFAEKIKNKLITYVFIELLIGAFGCISIPFLEFLWKSTTGGSYLTSFIYMFAFLSFPTILMGSTLPLLIKIFNAIIDNFLYSLSYLYFINTIGAALGALISSYLLISFLGLDTSIYFAAAINIIIATLIFIFKNDFSKEEKIVNIYSQTKFNSSKGFSNGKIFYLIVFVTGFIAIGYEIIWFRIIGTLVKASPYAFSSVLFIYLMGIACGSYVMKKYLSNNSKIDKKNLFFAFQFSIALFVLISIGVYYHLVENVPVFSKINSYSFANMYHPLVRIPSFHSIELFLKDFLILSDVFLWPLIFVFVPTLFMGASFPLITSLAYKNEKEGATVGKVYFFNVLGNVTGGLFTGLFFLSIIGTELSLVLLSLLGLLFGFLIKSDKNIFRLKYKIMLIVSIIGLIIFFFPRKHQLYGVIHPKLRINVNENRYINEGLDGVIATYSNKDTLTTYINGMYHGGRPGPEFYFETIEALSYKKQIKNILIIGFGTGSTTETILQVKPKPQITLVELSPTLIQNLNQINYLKSLLKDDSIKLIYADGRKYLYNNKEKFDAIFMDPLRTTTSFSNNLYSKQFFELINNHLSSDGIFMAWMDEYHIIPKTLCSVFPFVNQYSYFCVASSQELKQDTIYKNEFFNRFPQIYQNLLKIDSAEPNPISRARILENNINYPINEDYKPRCEYFVGMHFFKH
ncbi:MAG: fused MFS/spermidine synthase [Candidatus Hodarchaeota archaeon]